MNRWHSTLLAAALLAACGDRRDPDVDAQPAGDGAVVTDARPGGDAGPAPDARPADAQPGPDAGPGPDAQPGPDAATAFTLTIIEPQGGSEHEVGVTVHISGTTTCHPAEVAFLVDGQWAIGSAPTDDGAFAYDYAFNTAGPARVLTATATGAACTAVGSVTIAVVPAASTNPLDVPYFCQYENTLNPGSTCQNTSVAMVLAFYGWSGDPDTITGDWGKDHAQSPSGLAEVFESYSGPLGVGLTPHTDGTFAGLRGLIDQGKPVIVHGYFTQYGHVVVTVGYDDSGYYVNDPAGVWSEVYQGGYDPRYCDWGFPGDTVYYDQAAFEDAIGPDGTCWYHEVTP
jgi:uncharacterized protein YvpB